MFLCYGIVARSPVVAGYSYAAHRATLTDLGADRCRAVRSQREISDKKPSSARSLGVGRKESGCRKCAESLIDVLVAEFDAQPCKVSDHVTVEARFGLARSSGTERPSRGVARCPARGGRGERPGRRRKAVSGARYRLQDSSTHDPCDLTDVADVLTSATRTANAVSPARLEEIRTRGGFLSRRQVRATDQVGRRRPLLGQTGGHERNRSVASTRPHRVCPETTSS